MTPETPGTPAPAFDLVGIGEGMVEFHSENAFGQAGSFQRGYGGDVVNALIHASRLGLRVALVSRVGDDAFAPGLLAAWQDEGVDLGHAPVVPGENGLYFIMTDARGEREFLYRRTGSAASQLDRGDLDPALLASARFVLFSGITQAISATAEALLADCCKLPAMQQSGVFDPNYRPHLWLRRGGAGAAQSAFAEIAPHMAWLLPSYPADVALLGRETLDERAALRRFADASGANVALKLGESGVLLQVAGRVEHIPAVPVARIVDTTGAGDGWNAAFLHGLRLGREPAQAARDANAYAAAILGHRGAVAPRASVPGT